MLVTFSIWQGSMFDGWLLKDRWIGLLNSALKILCTFQAWQFLPSCPKVLLWFQATCRTWSLMSSELHDLSGLHISQLQTCPVALPHPHVFLSLPKEAACKHRIITREAGFWENWKVLAVYTEAMMVVFSCCVGRDAALCLWGMQWCMLCMDCNSTLYSLFLILSVRVQADSWLWLGAQQVRQAAGTGW